MATSHFSATVQLANLDDFITPSQACIKPVETKNQGPASSVTKVEVSLGDCLACSGCVTSAESVLISQQSNEELYKIINQKRQEPDNPLVIAVSLSLQSIASIANRHQLSMSEASEKLASFFVGLGVDYVYDISLARHISLIESCQELADRFQDKDNHQSLHQQRFPVLCSACPGWICYAEKTHGELVVPLLSRVKSPQQIMGLMVKRFLSKTIDVKRIYHVTIMPCFDKKLEASRNENRDKTDSDIKEVDCVLTPIEVESMLDRESVVLSHLPIRKLDHLIPDWPNLTSHLGSGSGGYAENLFRFAAAQFFGKRFSGEQLNYKTLRNRDFTELVLEDETGNRLLAFAIVNGFRNIQTLVQKIKRKSCDYHYVEVMACPGGCLNGGAQIRPDDNKKSVLEDVERLYRTLNSIELVDQVSTGDRVEQLYRRCLADSRADLYTEFKPVPKTMNLITVNW